MQEELARFVGAWVFPGWGWEWKLRENGEWRKGDKGKMKIGITGETK